MKFGEDEYSRYVEIDGDRFVVEPFPFKKYFWLVAWKRFEIIVWHLSKLTRILWQEEKNA